MYGNELIGGTIGNVGRENFSVVARHIMGSFQRTYVTTEILPITSLAMYDDGNVLEIIHVKVLDSHYCVQVLNGRVIDFQERRKMGKWEERAFSLLNIIADMADGILTTERIYEQIGRDRWIETQMEISRQNEIDEEIQLLNEMMWDTDNDFPPAAWGRLTELGF
jgi:hypothetical protein